MSRHTGVSVSEGASYLPQRRKEGRACAGVRCPVSTGHIRHFIESVSGAGAAERLRTRTRGPGGRVPGGSAAHLCAGDRADTVLMPGSGVPGGGGLIYIQARGQDWKVQELRSQGGYNNNNED